MAAEDFPGRCAKCGARRLYSERYDAVLCPVEDEWQESRRSDATCTYCPTRPAKPSEAADLELLDVDAE